MDLYGCGVNGINAETVSDIYVLNSVIRDCSYSPVYVAFGEGNMAFYDSLFTGSGGGFGFFDCSDAHISFYRCSFGEWESNSLYFQDDIDKYDCLWSEITIYPDYDEDGYYPVPGDTLELIEFDSKVLSGTAWTGSQLLMPEAGYAKVLPYVGSDGKEVNIKITFNNDGSGRLTGLYDDPVDFNWVIDDFHYAAVLYADGSEYSSGMLWLYAVRDSDDSPIRMELEIDDCIVWFSSAD